MAKNLNGRRTCQYPRRFRVEVASLLGVMLPIDRAATKGISNALPNALEAADRESRRATNLAHFRLAQRPHLVPQEPLLDCLDVIEVDSRVVRESFGNANDQFARQTPNRGPDRRHHRGTRQGMDLWTRQDDDRPPLVRRSALVFPDPPGRAQSSAFRPCSFRRPSHQFILERGDVALPRRDLGSRLASEILDRRLPQHRRAARS